MSENNETTKKTLTITFEEKGIRTDFHGLDGNDTVSAIAGSVLALNDFTNVETDTILSDVKIIVDKMKEATKNGSAKTETDIEEK